MVQAATLCGVLVGVVGAGFAALVWLGRSVGPLEQATDLMIGVLGKPLFWIGLLGVVVASHALRRRVASRG